MLKRAFYVTGILVALLVSSPSPLAGGPIKNISRPEKVWSVFHPFKALKVKQCADRARVVTDSLEQAGTMADKNGGQLDAFRHAYWMALMINMGMNEPVVRNVGTRHEKGNYIDFKKGRIEDSLMADSLMCVMDLRNNDSGIKLGKDYLNGDKKLPLVELIIKEIWNGNLAIMSKNEKGEYLDCNGNVVAPDSVRVGWYVTRCIVSSDRIIVAH